MYKALSDFIEDASLSVEQQVVLKTRSLWLPLLADNPWEDPKDEPPKFIAHDTIDIINVNYYRGLRYKRNPNRGF